VLYPTIRAVFYVNILLMASPSLDGEGVNKLTLIIGKSNASIYKAARINLISS
jgi:hypothetical protein